MGNGARKCASIIDFTKRCVKRNFAKGRTERFDKSSIILFVSPFDEELAEAEVEEDVA